MIAHTNRLFWLLYWVLVVVIGVAALLVAAMRLAYPTLPQYKSTIEAQLSELVGEPVSIGAIEAYWQGPNPVLELHDFQLSGALSVRFEHARLALNLPRSIAYREPIFDRLELESPVLDLTVGESRRGNSSGQGGAAVMATLLRQQQVSITDGSATIRMAGRPPLTVDGVDMVLNTERRLHQLQVSGNLVAEGKRAPLYLAAEVEGNPSRAPVNLYLSLADLNAPLFTPWLAQLGLNGLSDLSASQQLWARLRRGQVEYLHSNTDIERLMLDEQTLTDSRIAATLVGHSSGAQAQIAVDLNANGQPYRFPLMVADWRGRLEGRPDKIAFDRLDLTDLVSWLSAQPEVPVALQQTLAELRPRGLIENLNLHWETADWRSFVVDADLHAVTVAAWHGAPELGGVTGRLQHRIGGGSIDLDTQQFRMAFPELQMPAWDYSSALGRVLWQLRDDAVVVTSELLRLKNEQISAAGRFFLRLPHDREQQSDLTLLIGASESEAVAFRDYIPPPGVGEKTHAWLLHAVQDGRLKAGGFMLRTGTRSDVARPETPVVQLFLDVEKLRFGFDRAWPVADAVDGYFLYRDFGFLVQAKGRFLDSEVTEVWLQQAPGSDQLGIIGQAQGDARDLRRVLLETPLRSEVGTALADWEWSGQANTLVNLSIPLGTQGAPKVRVDSRLEGGSLVSAKHRLRFDQLAGALRFDSASGLQSDRIEGTLFGRPVKASISSGSEPKMGQVTRVMLDGSVGVQPLQKWLETPLDGFLEGIAPYRATLRLCTTNPACSALDVETPMSGVTVNAPAPLGKEAKMSRPLRLSLTLGGEDQQLVWLDYGDQLRSVFELRQNVMTKGQITFGGAKATLPAGEGLRVDGRVHQLELDALTGFLGQLRQLGGGKSTPALKLSDLDMQLGVLQSDSWQLTDLQVGVRESDRAWQVTAQSPILSGILDLPKDADQVARLDLSHLTFDYSKPKGEEKAGGMRLVPTDLPKLDLHIGLLMINEKPLGEWSVQMRPDQAGATFQNLKGELPGVTVVGDARWSALGNEYSVVLLNFKGENISPLLESWGHGKLVESQFLEANANFFWRGAPWEFSLGQLRGEFDLLAKEGRIIQAGGSGEFLRVLGILNLETVARRLRLDFSDLYKQGVAFDRVKADYALLDGVAHTRTPFELKGPSVNMTLSGQLDLVNETVEKDMEVILPVTKNLPIMSVLLGQPHIAGAVFLIDKLIGDKLEKFSTIRYHLSGDWTDPKLTLKQGASSRPESREDGFPFQPADG